MKFRLPSDAQAEKKKKIKRNMPSPPTATAEPFSLTVPDAPKEGLPPQELTMFVGDPTEKAQRMMWGTTRTLIANAITGQTTGFTLPVYLLGVGFRAALELDQRRLPATHKEVITAGGPDVQRTRLAMKLGYSHTVYIVVPAGIKVTMPSPTIIMMFGTDKAKVGQFAADIRKQRKPELYKGKVRLVLSVPLDFDRVPTHYAQGVFVGDEKIKMKSGKKK
jgi:large subunit ribosomal protein L6